MSEEVVYECSPGPYIVQMYTTILMYENGAPYIAASKALYPDMERRDDWFTIKRHQSLDEAILSAEAIAQDNFETRVIYDENHPVG